MVHQRFLLIDILHIQSQGQQNKTNPKTKQTHQNKTKNHQTKQPRCLQRWNSLNGLGAQKEGPMHKSFSPKRFPAVTTASKMFLWETKVPIFHMNLSYNNMLILNQGP